MAELKAFIHGGDVEVNPKKSFLEKFRTSKMPGLLVVPLVALAIVAGVFDCGDWLLYDARHINPGF
jgi:hypothetical protein